MDPKHYNLIEFSADFLKARLAFLPHATNQSFLLDKGPLKYLEKRAKCSAPGESQWNPVAWSPCLYKPCGFLGKEQWGLLGLVCRQDIRGYKVRSAEMQNSKKAISGRAIRGRCPELAVSLRDGSADS